MNREIHLPYGHETLKIKVPKHKLVGCFEPHPVDYSQDPARTLRDALAHPVGTSALKETAKSAISVVIVIDDASRPVPNPLLLNALMDELTAAGIKPEKVTVLVATGLHRDMTAAEIEAALGPWHGKIRCENHHANDPAGLVDLGNTSQGTAIQLNRTFMKADLKILATDVEYHQFCGFGGGAKSVYPGLADAEAIRSSHARMDQPGAGPGRLEGNPVRREIDEVGRMAGVDFLLAVVLDARHRLVEAYNGDMERAFRSACEAVDRIYKVQVPHRAELVIASAGGHPKDIDLYQSQKAIEEATRVVSLGGEVVVAAACAEGSGSTLFETWMEEAYHPDQIIERIQQSFVMGGHKAYQIAREIKRARVHLYSQLPPGKVRAWFMNPIHHLSEIEQLIENAANVTVLPQATLTLTCLANES